MNETTLYICAAAYLLGSIPFGVILTRMAGIDLRQVGSGNIGATNVLRTGKKALAVVTLLLDALKGTVAVFAAILITIGPAMNDWDAAGGERGAVPFDWSPFASDSQFVMIVALLVLLGHCFPVWLKFRGGKGVATLLGIWLALSPVVFLGMLLSWLCGALITRRSSCGALAMCVGSPILTYLFAPQYLAVSLVMIAIVVLKHRGNIARIIAGTEPKIGKAA